MRTLPNPNSPLDQPRHGADLLYIKTTSLKIIIAPNSRGILQSWWILLQMIATLALKAMMMLQNLGVQLRWHLGMRTLPNPNSPLDQPRHGADLLYIKTTSLKIIIAP